MFIVCWSASGGAGTTVVSAAVALLLGHGDRPCLAVDLAGDLPAAFGAAEPTGPGVLDWLAADDADPASLDRLIITVNDRVEMLPAGHPVRPPQATAWERLAETLQHRTGHVVVDAGRMPPAAILDASTQSWLVTRPCYLALRRAALAGRPPSGVVLLNEVGRALSRVDVARAVGVEVIADIPYDPAVARAVDAGLIATRLPAGLRKPLERACRAAA